MTRRVPLKKFLPVCILVALILFCVRSAAARVSFGVKGGVNLANISVSPQPFEVSAFKTLISPCGGIFFTLPLGAFGIQTEFMYARRGTQYEAFIDDGFYNVRWHHDYLEAIVLLKWSGLRVGPFRPFLLAGPSYGYLSRASSVIYDSEGQKVETVDSRDYFKKWELAAVFSAGLEFKTGLARFSLEGRYHLGLSSVALSGFEVDYIKNNSITILAGVSF